MLFSSFIAMAAGVLALWKGAVFTYPYKGPSIFAVPDSNVYTNGTSDKYDDLAYAEQMGRVTYEEGVYYLVCNENGVSFTFAKKLNPWFDAARELGASLTPSEEDPEDYEEYKNNYLEDADTYFGNLEKASQEHNATLEDSGTCENKSESLSSS